MSLGRRKVRLEDEQAWVFNRMADVYDARPSYPSALIDALHALALAAPGARVVELGAGIGHIAIPLSERGAAVTAVEPAAAMLSRLRERAAERSLSVRVIHATAEAVPLPAACADLVVIADALHFLDTERTGREIDRLLGRSGALAMILAEHAETAYMLAIDRLLRAAAPRRPRRVEQTLRQVAALARVELTDTVVFEDHTPVTEQTLQRILRSISFVGPAMNAPRFAALWREIASLSEARVWSRRLTLHVGRRR